MKLYRGQVGGESWMRVERPADADAGGEVSAGH
jgi:hypothetical protein